MIKIDNTTNNYHAFGKFIKIKGQGKHLEKFRNELETKSRKDFVSLISPSKEKHKKNLYLFSDKDLDKFIDIIKCDSCLIDFRKNPEKFMDKNPIKIKLHEAREKFEKNKLW